MDICLASVEGCAPRRGPMDVFGSWCAQTALSCCLALWHLIVESDVDLCRAQNHVGKPIFWLRVVKKISSNTFKFPEFHHVKSQPFLCFMVIDWVILVRFNHQFCWVFMHWLERFPMLYNSVITEKILNFFWEMADPIVGKIQLILALLRGQLGKLIETATFK